MINNKTDEINMVEVSLFFSDRILEVTRVCIALWVDHFYDKLIRRKIILFNISMQFESSDKSLHPENDFD